MDIKLYDPNVQDVVIDLPWRGESVVIKFFNEVDLVDGSPPHVSTEMVVLRFGKDFEPEGECVYSEVFTNDLPIISG